jgi:hypothetical protein
MNNEQKTAFLMALDEKSVSELWEELVIIRDELIEENIELPFVILSKEDLISAYLILKGKKLKEDENGNYILDINEIIDETNEGFKIKMIPELLAEKGFFTLGGSTTKGIYATKGSKKRYTLQEICEERILRKRIIKRILRKIYSNQESDIVNVSINGEDRK